MIRASDLDSTGWHADSDAEGKRQGWTTWRKFIWVRVLLY